MRSPYIACVFLFAATSFAATSSPCPDGICDRTRTRPADPIVRIVNQFGGSRSFGSGCIVECNGPHALVLTCGHLFRGGVGQIVVECGDGTSFGARLLAVDTANDLAAIFIRQPEECEPVVVAQTVPQPGDQLFYCGYGPSGRFLRKVGEMESRVRSGSVGNANAMIIAGSARQGDSGGPVFNQRGKLVGVIVATDGRQVVAPSCLPIRRLLSRFSDRFKTPSVVPPVVRKKPRLVPLPVDTPQNQDNLPSDVADADSDSAPLVHAIVTLRSRIDSLKSLAKRTQEPDWIATTLPVVLGALGISLPPVTAWFVWKVLRVWLWRRRRKRMRRTRGQGKQTDRRPVVHDRKRRRAFRRSRR